MCFINIKISFLINFIFFKLSINKYKPIIWINIFKYFVEEIIKIKMYDINVKNIIPNILLIPIFKEKLKPKIFLTKIPYPLHDIKRIQNEI